MKREALSFDDVLLLPQYSEVSSRTQIDISSNIGEEQYSLPIISSPMDTVTEHAMAIAMASNGGLGVIHRYNTIKEQANVIRETQVKIDKVAAAIGVSGDFLERAQAVVSEGAKILCVDVAHGHHMMMERALKSLRDSFGAGINIIAGNVATIEGFEDLANWGANAVRVGIGGGSICSTRIQTGHGLPTFQTVVNCAKSSTGAKIIADGGLRTSGDAVKALAAGADFVMLGSMLAGTLESPGDTFTKATGEKYKVYRGMASVEAQVEWRGEARSLEGVSTTIPYKGPVKKILEDLSQNIRSGLSYSGAFSIPEFQAKARFIRQTNSGMTESATHILFPK